VRVIADIDGDNPPLLRLTIFGAPHKRMHDAILQQYREELVKAVRRTGQPTPIAHVVDLHLWFIDPTSPDYDNLLTALYRALDGKALRGPSVLVDDGDCIGKIRHIDKMYVADQYAK
jgi:hypothetical protein